MRATRKTLHGRLRTGRPHKGGIGAPRSFIVLVCLCCHRPGLARNTDSLIHSWPKQPILAWTWSTPTSIVSSAPLPRRHLDDTTLLLCLDARPASRHRQTQHAVSRH